MFFVQSNNRPHLLESELERQSPDERCMQSFPTSFRDLEIGWRLDALDKEGGWYPSTIINVRFGVIASLATFAAGEICLHLNEFASSANPTNRYDSSEISLEYLVCPNRDRYVDPLGYKTWYNGSGLFT